MTRALLDLFAANAGRGGGPRCEAGADVATVYVYDVIGGWGGVEAGPFVKDIAAITAPRINLRINSPGGDVFAARAIKTAIEQHPAKVTAYVDGLAASAASFLMLAADEIKIAPGAFVMVHNAWTVAIGDARDMRATADTLDKITATIRADYARRTGLSLGEVTALMDAETWLDAEDAVAKKFADAVIEKPTRADARSTFDLSAYANAPAALTRAAEPSAAQAADEAKQLAEIEASRARQMKRLRLYS